MKNKINILLPTGLIIQRVPRFTQCGNFQIITVTILNTEFIVGDGDEYLRGIPELFTLNYDNSKDSVKIGKKSGVFYVYYEPEILLKAGLIKDLKSAFGKSEYSNYTDFDFTKVNN